MRDAGRPSLAGPSEASGEVRTLGALPSSFMATRKGCRELHWQSHAALTDAAQTCCRAARAHVGQ